MQPYNAIIGCDQAYFDTWGTPLLKSIQQRMPWLLLHCHIVNPTKQNRLDNVNITYEYKQFTTEETKISYLQAVRFLVAAHKFVNNEKVFTLDADTICTKKVDQSAFSAVFKHQYVLQHPKEQRWLAGFVTFKDNEFRQEYAKQLESIPFEEWKWGRDQTILNQMADTFNFKPLPKEWLSIGKNKSGSTFLTLKGEQKYTDKYLDVYTKYVE